MCCSPQIITQDMVAAEFDWKAQDFVGDLNTLAKKVCHRLKVFKKGCPDSREAAATSYPQFIQFRRSLLDRRQHFFGSTVSLFCTKMTSNLIRLDCIRAANNSDEGNLLLDLIRQAGNMGIWSRTLKTKSGLHQTVIDKCLKALEGQRAIKAVKSIKHPTRKMYLLYNTTPSTELTGGPWYSGSDLDVDFVTSLQKLCKKLIDQAVSSAYGLTVNRES